MKFAIFEYVCGNCGGKFDAPSVVEMSYGEFLLRSNRDVLACLNAVQDATFQEVGDLISRERSNLRPADRALLLQAAFGPVACDWDSGDSPPSPFKIDEQPMCPHCHARAPKSWSPKRPPTSVELQPVTHVRWDGLAIEKKVQEIRTWLAHSKL